jgi:tryptophan 2,3-dioxygenase
MGQIQLATQEVIVLSASLPHALELLRSMLGNHAGFRPDQWNAIESVAIHKKRALAFPHPFKQAPIKLPDWMR